VVRVTCIVFGSRPIIDAIAVRQIASTSKAGAPDARDMLANNIVNVIHQRMKSIGIPPLFPDRFFIFNPERCDGTYGDSLVQLRSQYFRDDSDRSSKGRDFR
jgi:hypothetical protein